MSIFPAKREKYDSWAFLRFQTEPTTLGFRLGFYSMFNFDCATFYKSHLSLILSRLLSNPQTLRWFVNWLLVRINQGAIAAPLHFALLRRSFCEKTSSAHSLAPPFQLATALLMLQVGMLCR